MLLRANSAGPLQMQKVGKFEQNQMDDNKMYHPQQCTLIELGFSFALGMKK